MVDGAQELNSAGTSRQSHSGLEHPIFWAEGVGMWMRCSGRMLGMQTAHRRWCQQSCQQNQAGKPCGAAVGNLQTNPRPWVIHAQGCVSLHSFICAFLTFPYGPLPCWESPSWGRQGISFWVSQHVTSTTKALKASGLCPALSSLEGGETAKTYLCRAQHSRNLRVKKPQKPKRRTTPIDAAEI